MHLPTHCPEKQSHLLMDSESLKGVGPSEFCYESWGWRGAESITRLWNRFEACFILSMVIPMGHSYLQGLVWNVAVLLNVNTVTSML